MLKEKTGKHNFRFMSVFTLTMMTIVSVDSVRNLPATAIFGTSLVFFYLLAALFFLFPTALVSAELALELPECAGIYDWVSLAFGPVAGLFAIWLQWIENIIWYPTILSFVSGAIFFVFKPSLADNRLLLMSMVILIFWFATILNLRGLRITSWASILCSIFGLLVPMISIITLGALWVITDHPINIGFSWHDFYPPLKLESWVSLTGIMLSCCGMEIAAVYIPQLSNPKKIFPRSLIYSAFIILFTLIFGGLSIAAVLPAQKINLILGLMQAFSAFLEAYNLKNYVWLAGLMLIIGGIGGVINWIIAPAQGLVKALVNGGLNNWLIRFNKYEVPQSMLISQACLVSILALIFMIFDSINCSYWILTTLASQLYMIMYFLMFAAFIKLRWSKVKANASINSIFAFTRTRVGFILIAVLGIVGSISSLLAGFILPESIPISDPIKYFIFLLIGLLFFILPPFILSWTKILNFSNKKVED